MGSARGNTLHHRRPGDFFKNTSDGAGRCIRFPCAGIGRSEMGKPVFWSVNLRERWQLSVDQEVRRLVRLVKSLPSPALRLWNGAQVEQARAVGEIFPLAPRQVTKFVGEALAQGVELLPCASFNLNCRVLEEPGDVHGGLFKSTLAILRKALSRGSRPPA